VAVAQGVADLLGVFQRGVPADLGVGTGAQTLGDAVAQLDAEIRL